jgi:hypothetical protein
LCISERWEEVREKMRREKSWEKLINKKNHNNSNNVKILTRSRTIQITDNVGHTGLVTHEGSQVDGFFSIVTGERLDFTTMTTSTFTGKEAQRTVTGVFEFTVRLVILKR